MVAESVISDAEHHIDDVVRAGIGVASGEVTDQLVVAAGLVFGLVLLTVLSIRMMVVM